MSTVPTVRGNASKQIDLNGKNLPQPSDAVVSSLRDFEKEFTNNVMGFTVEAEVRDYIRQKMSDYKQRQVKVYGAPVEIDNQYKKPYARGLAQPVETDAVHAEVNVGHSSHFNSILNKICGSNDIVEFDQDEYGRANRRLDIAVLEDNDFEHPIVANANGLAVGRQGSHNDAIEVAIAAGSKYFPPKAIETAIEVKYVKDMTTPGTINHDIWKKVNSDYEKFKRMNNQLNNPPELHLVIVTNYDPFRMAPHCDETREETKSRNQTQGGSSYPQKFKAFVQKCADINVRVWSYHPIKIYQNGAKV
jgi:hypothetical protein